MKSNILLRNTAIFLVALLPIAYLAIVWNRIPAQVVMHYNARLEPDRIGNKSELWVLAGVIAGISFVVYLLLQNIHLFDPKRKSKDVSTVFNRLAIGLVVFMAVLNCIFIISAVKGDMVMSRFLFPLLGLLFAFIGNYMHSIKPNYFAGFRLPWTLSDDENWRRTHKLGGKLWFWGGLGLALCSLFIPQKFIFYLFIPLMIVMVIVPLIYSFRLYKLKKNKLV